MSEAVKKEVSAIGYSIVANVVDNRQLTFQHFIASDATDKEVNADIDRIMRIIDRQSVLLEEPNLRKELAELQASIKQYALDLENVERDWQTAQDNRREEIKVLEARSKDVHDDAYAEHVKSGRQGQFKPRGTTEAMIRSYATDVAKLKAAMELAVSERGQARQQLEIAIKARNSRVEMIEAKLLEIERVKSEG